MLPTDRQLLGATRRALAGFMTVLDTPEEVVDDVILAMDEACSNVLVHAFPDDDDQSTYRLRADLEPDKIVIEVWDRGIGFDQMQKSPVDEDGQLAIHGRGLEVMRRLMTTVEVESATGDGGTRLRLVRKLSPTADSHPRHLP